MHLQNNFTKKLIQTNNNFKKCINRIEFTQLYFIKITDQKALKIIPSMSTTITTFQSLQTDALLSINVDFSVLKENFTVMNDFIKQFTQFQKKFSEIQKSQKTIKDNFSEFKFSTESHFMTINEILDSRNQISQGKSSAANEELNEIKKSIKQLKSFVTQSTRQEHDAQQARDKQTEKKNKEINQSIKSLQQQNQQSSFDIINLQRHLQHLSFQTAKKSQVTQLHFELEKQQIKISQLNQHINSIDKLLMDTKVEEFKSLIDGIEEKSTRELTEMKTKLMLKASVSDLLKLQQMVLNVTEFGFAQINKIMANKQQTKKALVFLEKRINSVVVMMLGDNQEEREGLLTAKQLKCISCTKDLGQAEGKLDKVKNWSVFPAKDSVVKEKYAGFGAGFQTIVQSTIVKKGGQVKYDEKGRMVEPFNLTGTFQGSLMKSSRSQHKIQYSDSKSKLSNVSPSKSSLKYETSFMHQFGRESNQQNGINITEEYYSRFRGLQSFVMANKKNQQKDSGIAK